MKLRAGNTIKYGIPYQGSKSKIIEQIAKFLPPAENFYDLFGGGFSVSHYMIKHRPKSYKYFYYNELRPGLCELIQDAINGKYNYDNFKPEWITRERFMAEKESNAYIKIVWSFGNNGSGYIFGKDIDNEKRSMHQAVVFNEFDDLFIKIFKFDKWPNHLTITGKRLFLKRVINTRIDLQQLQQLEQLQQLLQLEQLQQLERLQQNKLTLTNLDYKNVKIKPNSVIYCDIPYKGTADYGSTFNYDEFFNLVDSQENPVFISEYNIDDKRFHILTEISHRSTFSASDNNKTIEKLYCNKAAYNIINNFRTSK